MIKLSSPITVTIERKDGYYFINFSGDKSDIIYKVGGFSIIERNFFTLLSGNFKPDWRWAVSKETFTKEKFDSYVESVFSKIDFYKQCGVINPKISTRLILAIQMEEWALYFMHCSFQGI